MAQSDDLPLCQPHLHAVGSVSVSTQPSLWQMLVEADALRTCLSQAVVPPPKREPRLSVTCLLRSICSLSGIRHWQLGTEWHEHVPVSLVRPRSQWL